MDISSYGSAIEKLIPGTFVPDIGSQAPKADPLAGDSIGGVGAAGGSFKDAVKTFLSDVNDKQVSADQKSQALALGKSNDFEGTVKSVEEASLAMQFTLSIRNKLLEAYQEVERMQM